MTGKIINHFANSADNLDAAVFNGGGLLDAGNRDLFKRLLERWEHKLAAWEELAAEIQGDAE